MSIPKTVAWVGLAVGLAAASSSQPTTVTRRTPQFDNESVRVWKSTIAPGQPLSLHRHESGRVIVALDGRDPRDREGIGRIPHGRLGDRQGLLAPRRSPRREARRPEPWFATDRGHGRGTRAANSVMNPSEHVAPGRVSTALWTQAMASFGSSRSTCRNDRAAAVRT